jgi:hypothetical protein
LLRTLPTRRLILLVAAVIVVAVAGAAVAVSASARKGDTPPPASVADAIHTALNAPEPQGITADVKFTNNLFPSGALLGQTTSALLSGASCRLWITNDGRGRVELQSDAGDVQIVWTATHVSLYDASSNTAYEATLPAQTTEPKGTPPTVAEISDFLTKLAAHWNVSAANPANIAGQPAYDVTISPKSNAGLVGAGDLAWDASHGAPLRVAIYARGNATPALELAATDISYGTVAAADVNVPPPANAKIVDLGSSTEEPSTPKQKPVTGIDAVRAAAGFAVVAPDTIDGLQRTDATLFGSKQVVLVYGEGLGALVINEHKAAAQSGGGPLGALPSVSLDGVTAHELETQLGSVVTWQRSGVSFVLAGSVHAAQAEAAARALR